MVNKGINKVILIGNLGNNPDVRSTSGGRTITTISLATSDSWKDKKSGEIQKRTEWHRVVLFGKLAEIAGQYLKKGSKVFIEGKIQTRKWQDNSGQNCYTTEVVVDSFSGVMQMLDSRSNDNIGELSTNDPSPLMQTPLANDTKPDPLDDDFDSIPF